MADDAIAEELNSWRGVEVIGWDPERRSVTAALTEKAPCKTDLTDAITGMGYPTSVEDHDQYEEREIHQRRTRCSDSSFPAWRTATRVVT